MINRTDSSSRLRYNRQEQSTHDYNKRCYIQTITEHYLSVYDRSCARAQQKQVNALAGFQHRLSYLGNGFFKQSLLSIFIVVIPSIKLQNQLLSKNNCSPLLVSQKIDSFLSIRLRNNFLPCILQFPMHSIIVPLAFDNFPFILQFRLHLIVPYMVE